MPLLLPLPQAPRRNGAPRALLRAYRLWQSGQGHADNEQWSRAHIGFNHKGVAPPTQRFAVLFFYQYVSGIDHQYVDSVEQFQRER